MEKENILKGLTEEQIEKVKACRSHEELFALAKEEGIELNEEQLEAVSGGGCTSEPDDDIKCPKCGSRKVDWTWFPFYGYELSCTNCGHTWKKK